MTETGPPSGKRDRLLAAALALFEARGYDGVAVPEIAAAAQVAVGTLYRHFADKDALVNALFRHWQGQLDAIVWSPAPAPLGRRQLLALRWQRLMLFARTNPRALRFLYLHHHAHYLDAESRALVTGEEQAFEALAPGGRLKPALAAALVWGAAAGLLRYAGDGRLVLDAAAAADAEEALWRALGL